MAVEGDVFESLSGALMDSGAEHPTIGARSLHCSSRNHHLSVAVVTAGHLNNVVIGEVEPETRQTPLFHHNTERSGPARTHDNASYANGITLGIYNVRR